MRNRGILQLLLVCAFLPAVVRGDLLWGIKVEDAPASAAAFAGNHPVNRFFTGPFAFAPNDVIQQTSYANQASASDTGTFSGITFTADSLVKLSIALGDIGGIATADASGLDTNTGFGNPPFSSTGQGGVDGGVWFDTLYFSGALAGTPESFLVTSSFVASLIGDANATYDLSLGNCNLHIQANQTTPSVNDPYTCVLHAIVGQPLQVFGQLSFQATAISAPGGALTASADISDPAFFLDPITPGAAYSTASGATYVSTPEPSGLVLEALGLAAICGIGLLRRNANMQRRNALQSRIIAV